MGDYLKVYPVFRRIKKFYGRRFFILFVRKSIPTLRGITEPSEKNL